MCYAATSPAVVQWDGAVSGRYFSMPGTYRYVFEHSIFPSAYICRPVAVGRTASRLRFVTASCACNPHWLAVSGAVSLYARGRISPLESIVAGLYSERLDQHSEMDGVSAPVLGMVSTTKKRATARRVTLGYDSVLVIKIILGVRLLTYATCRRAGMEMREEADRVNDFGRDPIGEGKEEQVRIHFQDVCMFCNSRGYAAIQQGAQNASRQ